MRKPLLAAAAASLLATACIEEAPPSQEQNLDPFAGIKDLYEDGKNLDLNDLYSVGAGFATEQINDALSVSPYASVKLRETELYALGEDAAGDLTLGNLDALVTGLAARFGERELTTEVNAVRRDHLRASDDRVYGESAFKVGAGLHDFTIETMKVGDGAVRLGFDLNAELEARVIRAFPSEATAQIQSPLSAIRASRGFVLPRSVDDLRALKPGELVALRGSGKVGLNLGAGVPFLVASHGALSYSLVLSAGLRTRLSGDVDVQLVKMNGDELVVDVGVEKATLDWWQVAIEDSWGVTGLIEKVVKLGPVNLDLGKLADKALKKQLNDKLSLVSASVGGEKTTSRLSVARFRFNLSAATPDSIVERAIAQALRGDIRLAQALSNRAEPGVVAEFELSRSGASATSHARLDIFGMSFFHEVEEQAGDVVIQTPGGASTIHFASLHKEDGWFFESHGYTRVGLSGLQFDADDPLAVRSDANLFLQVQEGDEYMERDKLLDNLDGMILGLAGPDAFKAFDEPANQVERFVENACPNSQAFDPCRETVLQNPDLVALRDGALAALGSKLGHLEPPLADLVMKAGGLRVAAQAAYEPKAQLAGPATSIVMDFRLDSGSLDAIMLERDASDLTAVLQHYMLAQAQNRKVGAIDAKELKALKSKVDAATGQMEDIWNKQASLYRVAHSAERYTLPFEPQLGELGPKAIEVRFSVDTQNVPRYEQATASSLAAVRADVATALYDKLLEKAKGIHEHPEQPVTYALLMLAPKDRADVRIDVDFGFEHTWAQSFQHYKSAGYAALDSYARASGAAPIDGGMFDIDQLLIVK